MLTMTYIYGMKRIDDNMLQMQGMPVPLYFKVCWYFATPLLLSVTVLFTVYSYAPPVVGNYEYPSWAVALGWCMALASLAPIPLYIIYKLIKTPGTIYERFRINLRPNEKWGPTKEVLDIETFCPEKLWGSKNSSLASSTLLEHDVQENSSTGRPLRRSNESLELETKLQT